MDNKVIKTGKAICRASDLRDRESVKFSVETPKGLRGAFLFKHQGGVYAYLNLCQHIPMTLDYDSNEFFTPDGCSIICCTHGALYNPETGYCFGGPPIGESLVPLKIAVKDDWIYLEQREQDFRPDDL